MEMLSAGPCSLESQYSLFQGSGLSPDFVCGALRLGLFLPWLWALRKLGVEDNAS